MLRLRPKFEEIEFPATLYKYRAFNDFSLRILSHNEVFFASPDRLNDPADCALPVRYDIGTPNQVYKLNMQNLKLLVPTMSRKQIKRMARVMAERTCANRHDVKLLKEFHEETRANFNKVWSVFSLSACRENEVMWSHYGENHTGFCVGFNGGRLKRFPDKIIFEGTLLLFSKVDYYEVLPTINPHRMDIETMFQKRVFSKTANWSYEQEYRILRRGTPNEVLTLDSNIIENVTLGLKCSEENEGLVKGILRKRGDNIALLRVEEILGAGSMRLVPIAY